jgi:hypothetical protein
VLDEPEERRSGGDEYPAQLLVVEAIGLLDQAAAGEREKGDRGVELVCVVERPCWPISASL